MIDTDHQEEKRKVFIKEINHFITKSVFIFIIISTSLILI